MRVFITNTGHPTANIPPASMELELGNHTALAEPGEAREATRLLVQTFFSFLLGRAKVFVRFEDECPKCGVRGCPGCD